MAIDTTRQLIQQITNASSVGENTATRVGNAMEAMLNDVKAADDKAVAATNRINTTEQGIANANQRLTTEEGVNAAQSAQIEGLKQDLQNIRPVTIEGDVVNNPDNVFLTSANDEITPKERTTSLSAKGHYIMRPTDNFAAKLKANYIHEIPFDVDLGGASVTIPANAVLKFTGGKVANGSLVLQNTLLDGDVKLSADVAVSGTCANLTAKQSWFADNDIDSWHKFINNVEAKKYVYKKGTYSTAIHLLLNDRDDVEIDGNGAEITYAASGATDALIKLNTTHTNGDTFSITADAAEGSRSISTDISTLKQGDVVILKDTRAGSFNTDTNTNDGEILQVSDVSGNTINVPKLFHSYLTAYTDGVVVNMTRVNIHDLIIINSAYAKGILAEYVCGSIHDCVFKGAARGIQTYRSYSLSIHDNIISPLTPIGANVACYGISVDSSQKVDIHDNSISGGQHGITTGNFLNDIPVREIYIHHNSVYNEDQSTWNPSIQFHPAAEFCIVEGNIAGCVHFVGRNMTIRGNILRGTSNGISIQGSSLKTYDHIIADNQANGYLQIDKMIAAQSTSVYTVNSAPETLRIVGNTNVTGIKTFFGIDGSSHEYTNKANVNAVIEGNEFILAYCTLNSVVPVTMRNNIIIKDSADFNFGCNDIIFEGNKVTDVRFIRRYIDVTVANTSNDRMSFIRNHFKTTTDNQVVISPIAYYNMASLTLRGNYIENSARVRFVYAADSTYKVGKVMMADNVMEKEPSSVATFLTLSADDIYFGRLIYTNPIADVHKKYYTILQGLVHALKETDTPFTMGTTAERDTFVTDYYKQGHLYYDTDLKKLVVMGYVPASAYFKRLRVEAAEQGTPKVADNDFLTKGKTYKLHNGRALRHVFAFAKTNAAPDIDNLDSANYKVILDTSFSGAHDMYFTAEDPNVYPYLVYYSNAKGSVEIYDFHNVTAWQEADGATAGVLRSGTTANRPASGDIYAGFQYFDTTLGKPIFAKTISGDTVTWVDATGTTV